MKNNYKIDYNKNKAYTISQLKDILCSMNEIRHDIHKRITTLEITDYDYTNKYIYIKDYGYMYVTYQEKEILYNDEQMWLRGIGIRYTFGDYRDDSYFTYDATEDWKIPYNTFKRCTKNGDIKVITEEEFVSAIKEGTKNIEREIIGWVKQLTKDQNQNNE